MKIVEVLSDIRNFYFDEIPSIHEDFYIINTSQAIKQKFTKLMAFNARQDTVRQVENILPYGKWIGGHKSVEGISDLRRLYNRALPYFQKIDKHLVPTLSLLSQFLKKEDSVITIYNDAFISMVQNNKINKRKTIRNIQKDSPKLVIYPDANLRESTLSSFELIYEIIQFFADKTLADEDIINMVNKNKIYIVNSVALNRQDLLYYPTDRIEYDRESIYDMIEPDVLCFLSSGVEGVEASVFIRTIVTIRHAVASNKITFIESLLSSDDTLRHYGLKRKEVSLI